MHYNFHRKMERTLHLGEVTCHVQQQVSRTHVISPSRTANTCFVWVGFQIYTTHGNLTLPFSIVTKNYCSKLSCLEIVGNKLSEHNVIFKSLLFLVLLQVLLESLFISRFALSSNFPYFYKVNWEFVANFAQSQEFLVKGTAQHAACHASI